MSEKNTFMSEIINEVSCLDIAWYLKNEVFDLFKNLHYYKLKNICENLAALKEYLCFLDHHSTMQIHKLDHIESQDFSDFDHDVHYYVSKKWLDLVWEQKIKQKIRENNFNLSYIMLAVKWFLLLTSDEFCNASQTRMSINRMIWAKKLVD